MMEALQFYFGFLIYFVLFLPFKGSIGGVALIIFNFLTPNFKYSKYFFSYIILKVTDSKYSLSVVE